MNKILKCFTFALCLICIYGLSSSVLAEDTQKTVKLTVDGTQTTYKTDATTVEEFLDEQGIIIEESTEVSVPLDAELQRTNEITINSGVPVYITVDGVAQVIDMPKSSYTVAEFKQQLLDGTNPYFTLEYTNHLGDKNIQEIDVTIDVVTHNQNEGSQGTTAETVDETQMMSSFSNITFTTHVEATYQTTNEVPYETVQEPTFDLKPGATEVKTAGVNGTATVENKVVVDGNQVTSIEEGDPVVVTEPVDEVIYVGMEFATPIDDISSLPVEESITMETSGYTLSESSTGKDSSSPSYGITSVGVEVQPGVAAVDPDYIPYGTVMYVEGYGLAVAADTGGAVDGYEVDLYFETYDEAIQWGRKDATVHILDANVYDM